MTPDPTILDGGNIVLYCGDCLKILPTLEPGSVDCVVTDPPYGMKKAEWDGVVAYERWFAAFGRVLRDGASVYVVGATMRYDELVVAAKRHFEHLNTVIWLFPNGMNRMRDNWQFCYDPIFFGRKSGEHQFDMDAVRLPYTEATMKRCESPVIKGGKEWRPNPLGRTAENVIVVPCLNHGAGAGERTAHPTQKPIDLLLRLITASTRPDDTIIDGFMGSGTTIAAAVRLGRRGIGIEKHPPYFQIAVKRIQDELDNRNSTGPLMRAQERLIP
jgi:site-specific DNA-methyltransferase (adenine-specific)